MLDFILALTDFQFSLQLSVHLTHIGAKRTAKNQLYCTVLSNLQIHIYVYQLRLMTELGSIQDVTKLMTGLHFS